MIGTVYGDVHSVGKTMVSSLMSAHGFKIIDLGENVPTEQFLGAVKEHHPDILGLSALLTTTAPEQRKVIQALQRGRVAGPGEGDGRGRRHHARLREGHRRRRLCARPRPEAATLAAELIAGSRSQGRSPGHDHQCSPATSSPWGS